MSTGEETPAGTGPPPTGVDFYLVGALPPPGEFLLDGDEGRHAVVRRARPGQPVVVTDGRGRWARAEVLGSARAAVRLRVGRPGERVPADPRVVLVQGIPKGEAGPLAVDLATQAGVDEIVPWAAEHCVARWDAARAVRGRQRWQATAREAAKQARRPWVPQVGELADLPAVLARCRSAAGALVLHEAAGTELAGAVLPAAGELVLVIGPEGGVSPAEVAALRDAGAAAVRLGPEVLRSAVAGAVALGALGVLTRRWQVSR